MPLAASLVLVAPLIAEAQGGRRGEPSPAKYGWFGSLETGKSEARRTGKPLMVVLRCVP